MKLSWDEIVERGKQHNKTVICEVEKASHRRFKIKCNFCLTEKNSQIKDFNKCKICKTKNIHIFINDAEKIHGNKYNYDLVEYINSYSKIKIKCNKCNNIFLQTPDSHLQGRGCSVCSKNEEFISRSKIVHGDKYNYDLVEYINSYSKIKIKCNKCNIVFYQVASYHMRGSGCKVCFINSQKRNIEDFICLAKKKHGDKFDYGLVDYVNKRTKVKIKCNKCNTIFLQTPGAHLQGRGCQNCGIEVLRGSLENFILKANLKHNNKYGYDNVIYSKSVLKVKIFCKSCNIFFEQSPGCHLQGHGCKKCSVNFNSNLQKSNTEQFILKAIKKHGDKFDYSLVEYVGVLNKVKIKCNECNHVFLQQPNNHLNGTGCPKCNESKGENRVAKYLSENNIKFTKEKIFKTLRDKRYLKPDFYLEDINLLIEYDGEFHYKPIRGSTPEKKQKNLEDCQRRDKIKDEWAKTNNIPLLRIPYWDYNRIEELIEAFINQHMGPKEIKQLELEF